MLNFKNISPDADFYSKLTIIEKRLNTLSSNILYITHMQDKILKIVNKIIVDKNLQNTVDEYFEETSPQTDSDEQQLVIKTGYKTRRPGLPKKRPGKIGYVYETIKFGLKEFGHYNQIRKYDPGYYLDKYSYKPRKRIAGYLGQKIYESKTSSGNNKYRKTRNRLCGRYLNNKYEFHIC